MTTVTEYSDTDFQTGPQDDLGIVDTSIITVDSP